MEWVIKKILAFTYLHRHLRKLMPVLLHLKQDGRVCITLVVMTSEEEELAKQAGIQTVKLDDYTAVERRQNFDLAWGLGPLISIIKHLEPDLFLCMEVNFILRNAIRYCRDEKIASLVLQHGTPNKYSLHAFAPFEADLFACWGQFTKDYLIKNGVHSERIVLTGGVPFDRILKVKSGDRSTISDSLGLNPSRKWLLFTTQSVGPGGRPSYDEIRTSVNEIARLVLDYPDWQLCFQVHPQQVPEDILCLIDERFRPHVVVCKYSDTEELIAKSDAMITFFSTTAIDAVIMGKPLMLINLIDDMDYFPFVQMGAAYGVKELSEFPQAMYKLLKEGHLLSSGQKAAANFVNASNDGDALNRIVSLVYSLVDDNFKEAECQI